ncbi:MAG: exodeoxyribonuclease V subunit gamma, partial [Ideonella sp.]
GPLAAPVGQARATAAAAFDDIEPYPEVGGLQAELAGCLASLLAVLAAWSAQVSGPQGPATPAVWAERCRALLAALFRATDEADRQTVAALDEALDTWLQACDDAGFDDPLSVEVLREAWLGALDEPTLNRRFRAGGVTFCTLMPMRAIPFEVVCLLGMNDGDYPRRASHSDFDLMAEPGQARPGDRSRRDDDRQLMLEAVLSARRVLHVSWSGRSVRDNTEQPPSVLVSQLRDYLAAGWSGPVLADRTTEHPLQPFSRRYFEAGSALSTQAREWRAAHHGAASGAPEAARLPSFVPDPRVPLSLLQLTRFVRKPVQTFFRERLNVVFDEAPEQAADEEPFTLDGLEEYSLVDQLSAEVLTELQDQDGLQGLDEPAMLAALKAAVAASVARVQRAGRLPMGAFAERTAGRLTLALLPMLHAWQAVMNQCSSPAPRRPLAFAHDFRHHGEPADVSVALADWLDGLHLGPDGQEVWPLLQPVRLCKTKPKGALRIDKLLPHWLRSVVAAACAVPADGWVVGRDVTLICRPPEPEAARATLAILLQCWFDGMREPLPMALLTGLAQLETGKAEQVYEGGYQSAGERAQDDCLARAFPDFEALQADGRFPDLAEAMLGPLLHWAAHCVTVVPHPDWNEDSEDGDGDAGERGEDDDDA